MTRPFLPFALPEIGEEEIAEVVDTLRSGWVTTGPKVQRFEAAFAAFLGADGVGDDGLHALAVNSATAGLHLALEALGIGPGDEVITTTHTFTATAEVVRYLGADVVLVDIDPATLCIDAAAVAAAITPRTKAIVPVHYAGLAADMTALLALAAQHGLKVVEDAAHALPTTCGGRLVGTLASDVTVFSFYANKTITTGEGGMAVTRDAALAQRMRTMRLHGMSRDAFDRFTATVPSWYYEIVAPGYKYNLTDIAAAIGIHQLKRLAGFQARRERLADLYDAALAGLPVVLPPRPAAGDRHAWHLYVLRLADSAPIDRNTLIERLYAAGIGCSVHYIPLHLQPYWRDRYDLVPAQFPASQHAYERMLSLPLYTRMTEDDVLVSPRRSAWHSPDTIARVVAKRAFDLIVAALGLLALSPLLAAVAVWIKLDSPGPVLFRQERVGRHGVVFRLHKFRTMRAAGDATAPQITARGDARVTRAGRVLRHAKLDELPQLLDVVAGRMSLVGPRPEVPRYVALYPPELRQVVLSVRPGLTDPATLAYRHEESLLAGAVDPDAYYVDTVLPDKLRLSADYVRRASFAGDLRVLAATFVAVLT